MSDRLFIFYTSGGYGSWLEWVIQHCHLNFTQSLNSPLMNDGSSHKHVELVSDPAIYHPLGHAQIKQSLTYNTTEFPLFVFRAIPRTNEFEKIDEIVNLAAKTENCILISVNDTDMKELVLINTEYKINPVISQFASLLQIKQWNKDASTIDDLQRWEKREMLSLFYPAAIESLTNTGSIDSSVLNIDIRDILFSDVESLIIRIFEKFNFPLQRESIETIKKEHSKMLRMQKSLVELKLVNDVVIACLNNQHILIPPISLMSEAIIQKRLRDVGYEIRCFGLNEWPTSTQELVKLLDKC